VSPSLYPGSAGTGRTADVPVSIIPAMVDRHEEMPPAIRAFQPSPEPLVELFRRSVTDRMLEEIADCDFSAAFFPGKLPALRELRDRPWLPDPVRRIPREELTLTRWEEPGSDPEGNCKRLFACATILCALDLGGGGPNTAIIILVESALRLGPEAASAAMRFLAWVYSNLPTDPLEEWERPFFVLGILLLAAALWDGGEDVDRLVGLSDLVEADVKRRQDREEEAVGERQYGWLLGSTGFDLRHRTWRRLVREVLIEPARPFPAGAAARLCDLGERIASEEGRSSCET
jgi:hypothetical protein